MEKLLRWVCARPLPYLSTAIALLIYFSFAPVTSGLQDDWYSFVSFQDPTEWKRVYGYTCQYKPDHFREPREYARRDDLLGPRELKSPIAFRSKDTLKSKENYTLHIYNSPAIRKGYSVSYGFQRNKECLHGQDSDCIVYPNLGRIRAVVVNAERFSDKQNLNFIKDHFLIEEPERFATILNGGSIFERKFYEAVFLGGYTRDPERSSHQIDGKKYPMEIYMYFLDETVPSVSLSTILVVLVEESDRENIYIKPIVNAVEGKLYNAERRFLEENRGLLRRERLFHHLEGSTTYDINDRLGKEARGEPIYQETLEHSEIHEGKYTRIVETFEKMESLETELFFLYEDLRQVNELYDEHLRLENEFNHRQTYGEFFPTNVTELHIMAFVALIYGWREQGDQWLCDAYSKYTTQVHSSFDWATENVEYWYYYKRFKYAYDALISRDPVHLEWVQNTTTALCLIFSQYNRLYQITTNDELMRNLTVEVKYEIIRVYSDLKKLVEFYNDELYKHYHESPQFHFKSPTYIVNSGANLFEYPEYKYREQKYQIADGMLKLLDTFEQRKSFEVVREGILDKIKDVAAELQYKTDKTMKQVIRYIKFGDRAQFSKYPRIKVHSNFVNKMTPEQEKKRSLVEYGGMGMTEEQIQTDARRNPIKEIVADPFQISWLIPPSGGYYYYKGSSPLPPCFRAQNVIVFKRPIKMSRRQINILARVPTSFDRSEDIRVTTPYVHDTYFEVDLVSEETEDVRSEEVEVPVYNEVRNHLFLGRDGVHKNAVEEWGRLLEMKKKSKAAAKIASKLTKEMIMMFVLIVNIVLG